MSLKLEKSEKFDWRWWGVVAFLSLCIGFLFYIEQVRAQSQHLDDIKATVLRIKHCGQQLDLYYNSCSNEIFNEKLDTCMHKRRLASEHDVHKALDECANSVALSKEEQESCIVYQYDKVQICMNLFAPKDLEKQINDEIK